MAQHLATSQGTKRRYSGFSSPQTAHPEESETRRLPYSPLAPMGGLQAPQVGVAVVTVDMFREYQSQVMANFERQSHQIALLQERTQTLEGRIQSLEDAEDMAIDAVREIRDGVLPRLERHQEGLDVLSSAVARHSTLLETLGNQDQEVRANQGRDASRSGQISWRPGPLGGTSDQTKSTIEDLKAQIAKSFATLAEHERRLENNDSCLGTYHIHLSDHDRRLGEYDTRISALDRHMGDHTTHLLAQDRRFGEHSARLAAQEGHIRNHDMCVAKHNERLGVLENSSEKLSGRFTALEQRTDYGLSPAQISAIMQNHQQRLESLEQTLQRHIKASEAALAGKPNSPHSRPLSAPGPTQITANQARSESHSQPDQPSETAGRSPRSADQPSQQEVTNNESELRRLGERLEGIKKRLGPLEERMELIEKDFEKLPQSAAVAESIFPAQCTKEDLGQYEILRRANFLNPEDLAALRVNEGSPLLMQLFSENDQCDNARYTVQRTCDRMWSRLICRDRKDEKLIPDSSKRDEWKKYPRIIELERSASMAKGKYFPRYFYEIGEIFNRKEVTGDSGRQATHRSTGYHLAVDVTKPEKALWLIHRRHVEDRDDDDDKQDAAAAFSEQPFADVCVFDIAMVFERFEDWRGADTPAGSFAASKSLVQRTAGLIKPTFVEAVLDEVKDEMRRNWGVGASASRAGKGL